MGLDATNLVPMKFRITTGLDGALGFPITRLRGYEEAKRETRITNKVSSIQENGWRAEKRGSWPPVGGSSKLCRDWCLKASVDDGDGKKQCSLIPGVVANVVIVRYALRCVPCLVKQ